MKYKSESENLRLTVWIKMPREVGSVTLEYMIVSTFAVLLSIAAIAFVGRVVKTKVDVMAEKLQMNAEEFDFDLGFTQ